MSHILLTINAGSSSLKISAFLLKGSAEAPQKIAAACIRGINTATTTVYYARYHETVSNDITFRPKLNWCEALSSMLAILLQDPELREVHSTDDIRFVCHRIVHGKGFREPQLIDQKLFDALAEATHLAPLHSWVALTIVALCKQQFQNAANIACFDTQFHVTIPKHIYTYPIDQDVAQQHGLRKYGFHGLSYSYLARSVCKFLGTDQAATNLIALHLGSGASVCAIQNGKSLDTSMGLTPLSGLFGATRSGTIDPSLVFHCSRPASASLESPAAPDRAGARCFRWPSWERMLNAESGWCSLTGTTDFAIIAASSHSNCKLAFDMFVNRICGYIGSYYVALQGRVDALVFAGGIGEKCPQLRAAVVEQLAFLGFAVDEKCNLHIVNSGGRLIDPVRDIGVEGQKHRVLVCQTDEETEMSHICVDMGLY